ncbi:cytochrome P450 [Nemania sp. FL0031]|nr:cytochrome P450 [Nemania sp. FL0031]
MPLEEVWSRAGYGPIVLYLALAAILFLGYSLFKAWRPPRTRKPPQLSEKIPFVSNTIEYLTNVGAFNDKVAQHLALTRSNIVKFYVGFIPVYIVTGTKNVQTVLNSPHLLDGNFIQLVLMEKHWDMTKDEIRKFANDKSGRSKVPAPGTENTPEDERYWLGHDRLYVEYLSNRKYADSLAELFYLRFSESLDTELSLKKKGEPVKLFALLKKTMAESAIIALFGSQIIDLNPGFIDCYWRFDDIAGTLAWGLPRLFQRKAMAIRDELHIMTERHIDSAWDHQDKVGIDPEADWEPHFGSRLSRETAKWLRKGGFSNHAAAGHTLATLFGLNGNTVPITAWAMIELVKDPSLLAAIKEEVLSVAVLEPTGGCRFDADALTKLPLLQSLYIEIMRMHVSFNATRKAVNSFTIDGCLIEKGALVQTCSQIAHFEEDIWSTMAHPASEFWAWRHVGFSDGVTDKIGEVPKNAKFAMRGRPSSFFPYGGGYVICPGRHFAKQEILLAIATLVSKFNFEFVEWVGSDGSPSQTPPRDDRNFAGFIAMHPDKDIKVGLTKC